MSTIHRAIPCAMLAGAATSLTPFAVSLGQLRPAPGTGCAYTDIAALGLGTAAVLCGLALLRIQGGRYPLLRCVSGFAFTALGILQVLRGAGVIMSPCG